MVSRHTRTKGRVVESAGIRFYRKRSGPDRWHNRPWSGSGGGRQGTDPLPAIGTARPLGFEERECLDTYELLNNSSSAACLCRVRRVGSGDVIHHMTPDSSPSVRDHNDRLPANHLRQAPRAARRGRIQSAYAG